MFTISYNTKIKKYGLFILIFTQGVLMRKIFYALFFTQLFLISSLYAKSDFLISAEEAVKLMGKDGVVFVSGDSEDVYSLGHIDGSVEMYAHHLHHSDLDGDMHCAPLFMCPDEAEEYIGSKGIDNDTLVIAYDDFRGPNATGVFAFFKSFGHDNIKILNGGRSAIMEIDPNQKTYDDLNAKLIDAKRDKNEEEIQRIEIEMEKIEPKLLVKKGYGPKLTPKKYKVDISKIDESWIVGKYDVLKASNDILEKGEDSKYIIIDSRGMNEITGDRKLDNVARGGHVPGAKFLEWKHITDFDDRLSFRTLEEMEETFKKIGVSKDKIIYSYCHVGAGRSSHIITALKMLGYENAKVYTGSWDEWGNDMNLPISR